MGVKLMQPPSASLVTLLADAKASEAWLRSSVTGLAGAAGGKFDRVGFKADGGAPSARAKEKARIKGVENNDAPNGHRYLKDMIRCSVRFGSCGAVKEAISQVSRFMTVVEAKDHVKHPKPGGYIDYNLIVQNPKTGHLCEVQFHFDLMIDAKHEGGHAAYRKERAATGGARIRDMTDPKARGHAMRAIHKGQAAYCSARVAIDKDPDKQAMFTAFDALTTTAATNASAYMSKLRGGGFG